MIYFLRLCPIETTMYKYIFMCICLCVYLLCVCVNLEFHQIPRKIVRGSTFIWEMIIEEVEKMRYGKEKSQEMYIIAHIIA